LQRLTSILVISVGGSPPTSVLPQVSERHNVALVLLQSVPPKMLPGAPKSVHAGTQLKTDSGCRRCGGGEDIESVVTVDSGAKIDRRQVVDGSPARSDDQTCLRIVAEIAAAKLKIRPRTHAQADQIAARRRPVMPFSRNDGTVAAS
jgi:hypothetical protein